MTTLRTCAGSTVLSPITGRNAPLVNSEAADAAAFRRSIDFGVKTMSGLWCGLCACQRSRWK